MPDPFTVELPDPKSWAQLVRGLGHAADIDRAEPRKTTQPGLKAAWLAMSYLFDFLSEQPAFINDPSAIAPIARVYTGLRDLHRGHLGPMFQIPKKAGAQSDRMMLGIIKGVAARALSELISAGVPKDEAATKVAGACGTLRELGRVSRNQVINWRARYQGKPGPGAQKDGPNRFAYDRKLPEDMGGTAAERADSLLRELRSLASNLV
jgi:hypothetical protein